MFADILRMIFDSFKDVINAFDVPILNYDGISFTFWEIVLGIFTVSLVFGFFLRTRGGSVLDSVGNYNEYQNSKRAEAERQAEKDFNNSFQGYAQKRYIREMYNYEYNRAMGKNALPKHKGGK